MRVFTDRGYRGPRSPSALQRPLPRDDHQRRRRLQPLARPGRHALARRRHARLLGHASAICATSTAARSGPPPGSRRSGAPKATRPSSRRRRAEFRRRDRRLRHAHRNQRLARRRHRAAARHITNRSRVRRTIELTSYAEVVLAAPAADAAHPGVQQSVRADRDSSATGRRFSARAGRARATSSRRGCCT